jgi:hypothetical protein
MHSQESKPGGVGLRIMDKLAEWSDGRGGGERQKEKRCGGF